MRIAINGMFWAQPNVGSGQYLHGLLGALARVAPAHEYILLLPAYRNEERRTMNDELDQARSSFIVHHSSFVRTPFDGRNENFAKLWFEQIGVPRAARRLQADLLHVPYFAPPLVSPIPVVATVLDIIPRLGCAPERVSTIPLAAGAQYRPLDRAQSAAEVAERYGLREPFVYYVGGLDARKNLPTLLCAWARLRHAGGPMARLAIAGRALGSDTRLFPDLNRMIAELGIHDSVARIDVPLADNPLLYNAASAFAFPSRY